MSHAEIAKKLDVIFVDLNADDVPSSIKDLQPLIYRDGNNICIMQGDNPMEGIFGCGDTLPEAMADFQKHYEEEKENSV